MSRRSINFKKLSSSLWQEYLEGSRKAVPSEVQLKSLMDIWGLKFTVFEDREYENGMMAIGESTEVNFHNLHHFVMAPESRRMTREFGLGSPPNEKYYPLDELLPDVSEYEGRIEEDLVITLDLLRAIEGKYFLKSIVVRETSLNSFLLRTLFNWGFIDESGKVLNSAIRQKNMKIQRVPETYRRLSKEKPKF